MRATTESGLAVACAHQKKLKERKNKGGPFIINFSPPRKHSDGANYCQNVTPSPAASLSTELYPQGIRMTLNTVRWAHLSLKRKSHWLVLDFELIICDHSFHWVVFACR